MNYMPYIINYLSTKEDITELYLVPKAFITERRGNKLVRASDFLLNPEDIRDTLIALRSHTPSTLGPLGKEGVFSLGIQTIGRFRVSYITQRGSYVVHIVKTPYNIPPINNLCQDKNGLKNLEDIVRLHTSGVIIFQSKNQALTSTFVYSFLQSICERYNKVIYILESPLSFLLKHGQSLVIQREVGVDVENFEEGVRDAFYINPDILYLGQRELIPQKEVEYLKRLVEEETLIFLNLPVVEKELLNSFEGYLRIWINLEIGEKGFCTLNFKHTEPQALENH